MTNVAGSVWVSDQGYTDECYNATLSSSETINIRVVAVNDAPKIRQPSRVMSFQKGGRCYVDYMEIDRNDEGLLPTCYDDPNSNTVPPGNTEAPISFTDIDMNDSPYGNISLFLQVSAPCTCCAPLHIPATRTRLHATSESHRYF